MCWLDKSYAVKQKLLKYWTYEISHKTSRTIMSKILVTEQFNTRVIFAKHNNNNNNMRGKGEASLSPLHVQSRLEFYSVFSTVELTHRLSLMNIRNTLTLITGTLYRVVIKCVY